MSEWAILGVGIMFKNRFGVYSYNCTSCQLASKDANRSWVGFKDSKDKNKVILTILLEIMYSGIEKS